MNGYHEETTQELESKLYKTMIGYFSSKDIPTGFFNTVGSMKDQLATLNINIKESSESSSMLAKALNNLTFRGVLVAGFGVLVALGGLIFEIYKHYCPVNNGADFKTC